MTKKFRLRNSKYLADTYQEAVQSLAALADTDATDDEIAESVSEIPTVMLIDLLSCYISAYEKLLEYDLVISCTKKLINSDTLH